MSLFAILNASSKDSRYVSLQLSMNLYSTFLIKFYLYFREMNGKMINWGTSQEELYVSLAKLKNKEKTTSEQTIHSTTGEVNFVKNLLYFKELTKE